MMLWTKTSQAYNYNIVDLNSLSLDYRNYGIINKHSVEPLIYPYQPKENITLDMNLGIVNNYGYINSSVQAITDVGQYRNVGLELHIGVHLADSIDVGFYHHSSHMLDNTQPLLPTFPESDAAYVKIYLYKNDKVNSIF